MSREVIIRGGLLIYPEKTVAADLVISGGKISKLLPPGTAEGKETLDASGLYILPGLIDPHSHPVYLDDIAATSRTAAFGGVTCSVHYAYARPGDKLADKIRDFRERGEAASYTDFALHGGLFET